MGHFSYQQQLERELQQQPQIRVFKDGRWRLLAIQVLQKFSATCWFFGSTLSLALRNLKGRPWPLGLLVDGALGVPLVAFLAPDRVSKCPKPQCTSMVPGACTILQQRKRNHQLHGLGEKPGHHEGFVYRMGLFQRIQPLPLRAVIFYQGESDILGTSSYNCRQRQLVSQFRSMWGPEVPFILTVVAGIKEACGMAPFVRQEQLQLLSTPAISNIGVATAHDLGHPMDIHPPDKREVGRRLALTVLATVYGHKDVVHEGPRFQWAQVSHVGPVNATVIFGFERRDDGPYFLNGTANCVLCCKHLPFLFSFDDRIVDDTTTTPLSPRANGLKCNVTSDRWRRALHVQIQGSQALVQVVVPSSAKHLPHFARFQYEDEPQCGLYNRHQLPAYPFQVQLAPLGKLSDRKSIIPFILKPESF
mmetsp:Transcript_2985/g.5249  ORF Transcript_2985/g.5249 Transcript_2985/m.5249 type:complete len:418 (-) Transcript_2985:1211-2464(-)